MLQISATDAFERAYMQRFRALAGQFGEFVTYERDRGARDLGLHLTHKLASGKERLSAALCWFQMKGIMASTLSKEEFNAAKSISVSLEVAHLRYWFLQPAPTHLVVYVEAADEFLVLNLQDFVTKQWGTAILTLDQKTATVPVPTESRLDKQAFHLLITRGDIDEWAKAINTDKETVRLCRRDYDLIWHFGTAEERSVEHRVVFWDWQSKTRGQCYVQERGRGDASEWQDLREHWQYLMNIEGLESAYPYLELFDPDRGPPAQQAAADPYPLRVPEFEDSEYDFVDDERDPEVPPIKLSNRQYVEGENYMNEYFEYVFGVRLNDLGQQLFESVLTLQKIGLLEVTPGKKEWISIAPWHSRAV